MAQDETTMAELIKANEALQNQIKEKLNYYNTLYQQVGLKKKELKDFKD